MTSAVRLICILAVACATGCATQSPELTGEMTRAKTLVDQADRAGAQRYAAADLQRAHDELTNADRAIGEGKYDEARRDAESAAADADVASARAAAGEAQRAAHEVVQGNETLRRETEGRDSGATAPPPDSGTMVPPDNGTTAPPPPDRSTTVPPDSGTTTPPR
jgi:Domain of unknown function (DUF4398)